MQKKSIVMKKINENKADMNMLFSDRSSGDKITGDSYENKYIKPGTNRFSLPSIKMKHNESVIF